MNWRARIAAASAAALLAAPAVWAWGPKSELAIVTTAYSLISKESNVQLDKFDRDLRDGARVDDATLEQLCPEAAVSPVAAIESQMYLLQSVRGPGIDPYFAYRLGVLGKLVADLISPLYGMNPALKAQYDVDSDRNIGTASLKPGTRDVVDPKVYLAQVMGSAATRNEVIQKDYQEGAGFGGLAGSSLSEDASRSVDAVLDVWYTILSGRMRAASVSEDQVRGYVLGAHGYYIGRGNLTEIKAASERLSGLATFTADMRVKVGDLYFGAGFYDEAMAAYQEVLAVQPDRRDVVEKIAAYYVEVGEKALNDNLLEEALKAFDQALAADPLHPTAQGQKLEAQQLIEERDARLASARSALDRAAELESLSDQEVLQNHYAEGIALLQEALNSYDQVDNEFPEEYQRAVAGLKNARIRVQELREQLMLNAQAFSGSGDLNDVSELAAETAQGTEQQLLRAMLRNAYDEALARLERDLTGAGATP